MRLAAPWFAERISRQELNLAGAAMVLCSPFLDVATFIGLLPAPYKKLPVLTYFHENQFVYPARQDEERDIHFSLTNLTTALASERIAFNSAFNLESFLAGCREIMTKNYDMQVDYEAIIRAKASILYPGQDFAEIDRCAELPAIKEAPVILWNHRWEHDKNPESFFQTLFELARNNTAFKLIVVGQSFRQVPAIFNQAEQVLADRIIHFGYARSRADYLGLLKQADLIVSTATQEFFGISVVEAVRAGCRPLLPNRLAYRELFPGAYLYEEGELQPKLLNSLRQRRLTAVEARQLTEKFSWTSLRQDYNNWFGLGDHGRSDRA